MDKTKYSWNWNMKGYKLQLLNIPSVKTIWRFVSKKLARILVEEFSVINSIGCSLWRNMPVGFLCEAYYTKIDLQSEALKLVSTFFRPT